MASRQSWKNEKNVHFTTMTDFFSFFQLWRLAILEPVGVQRRNVPHFKGLILLELDSRSSRALQHIYLLPRPCEKGHFTPKNGYCPIWFAPHCKSKWIIHDTQANFKFLKEKLLHRKFRARSWQKKQSLKIENFFKNVGKTAIVRGSTA